MNKRKKRVLFSWFFTGWLAATRWEWQDQPWLVNYFNWLISISTNVLLLFALCEIVTYSTFTGCSASILVISIGVFCFRAELQIETTQDYATDSWFFNVFTGLFSLRTNSPFGVFARIHVTTVHERWREYEGRKKISFSPSLVASPFACAFSRFTHQNWRTVKVLYESKVSASVQYSEDPSVILVPSFETRERRNSHACAFRVSRCLAPFSLAARILREAFLCSGVVCFVSLL